VKKKLNTISELLYWSYANLAMAHAALLKESKKYGIYHYKIRSRLFSGLKNGSMNVRDFFDDERLKMVLPQACCYCGSNNNLSADHIIPKIKGGSNKGENLVWSCRSCNSSKGSSDMVEWLNSRNQFPTIFLLRRYLKLVIEYCKEKEIMDLPLNEIDSLDPSLPFTTQTVPVDFPQANEMKLWIVPFQSDELEHS
jgi:HNH endonuclease